MCFHTAPAVTTIIANQTFFNGGICRFLVFTIDSKLNTPAGIDHLLAIAIYQGAAGHLCQIGHVHIQLLFVQMHADGFFDGCVMLSLGDITKL